MHALIPQRKLSATFFYKLLLAAGLLVVAALFGSIEIAHGQFCTEGVQSLEGPAAVPYYATENAIGNPPYEVFEDCQTGFQVLYLEDFYLGGVPDLTIECWVSSSRTWTDVGVFSSQTEDNLRMFFSQRSYDICALFSETPLPGVVYPQTTLSTGQGGGGGAEAATIDSSTLRLLFPGASYSIEPENRIPGTTVFVFSGIPGSVGSSIQPRVAIYPVDGFGATHYESERVKLAGLIASRPDLAVQYELPYLPPAGITPRFHAQEAYVSFETGSGLRYLTSFNIDGTDVFYTFQGLTADGEYYVSATFPASTGTLLSGSLTTGQIVSRLNGADASSVTPELARLDALMASLSVTTPPPPPPSSPGLGSN